MAADNFIKIKGDEKLCQQETEQDQMVKARAQGAEQETAGMEVEPDHPGKFLSSEMRPAAC